MTRGGGYSGGGYSGGFSGGTYYGGSGSGNGGSSSLSAEDWRNIAYIVVAYIVVEYIVDCAVPSAVAFYTFALCCLAGAVMAGLCCVSVFCGSYAWGRGEHRHVLSRTGSGTVQIDGIPIVWALASLSGASFVALAVYAFLCDERVDVLPGQTKLVAQDHAYFLGEVTIRRTDERANPHGELEAYYFSAGAPPLTGPRHCGGFNSTLSNLRYGHYKYDTVELNAGGEGFAKLWVDDAECSSGVGCELDLSLYKRTEPTKKDGHLKTPSQGPAFAKASDSVQRPATLPFKASYTNQAYAVTYYYNNNQPDDRYAFPYQKDGTAAPRIGARATVTYCEPTFDLRARGDGWRDVCVGSPCTLFVGSGVESSAADGLGVAFASTASLVLVAPGAAAPVEVAVVWRPRWYLLLGIAVLPLLVSACVTASRYLILAEEWAPHPQRPLRDAERDPLVVGRVDPRAPAAASSLNSGAVPTTTAAAVQPPSPRQSEITEELRQEIREAFGPLGP